MEKTAVEWYSQQHLKLLIKLENKELSIGEYAVQHQEILNQAREKEINSKLRNQLFIGKVSEIIGENKTIELLVECRNVIPQ